MDKGQVKMKANNSRSCRPGNTSTARSSADSSNNMKSIDRPIAVLLQNWSIKEMQFNPQGKFVNCKAPVYEDFNNICRGPMADIWHFVLDSVYSLQTVKKMKGNLALNGSLMHKLNTNAEFPATEDRKKLIAEKIELSGQLSSLLSDVDHLENDMDRYLTNILNTESDYRKLAMDMDDIRKKSHLLICFSRQCAETIVNNNQFTERMQAKTAVVLQKSHSTTESVYITTSKVHDSNNTDTGDILETICKKRIRESFDKFEDFLKDALKGNLTPDKQVLQNKKSELWIQVEKISSEFLISHILTATTAATQQSTLSLRDKTNKINIRKDAENLRFEYGQGELVDTTLPYSSLHSVRQLLEHSQLLHVQRFMETEKHKNQTWRGVKIFEDLQQSLDKLLVHRFNGKPGELELAKILINHILNLSSSRSGLHTLQQEAECIREAISKGIQEKNILQTKFFQIKTFRDLTEQRQNLIRVLIKQNVHANTTLNRQKNENQTYIHRSLMSHHSKSESLLTGLDNHVQQEVEKLKALSLPYLMFVHLGAAGVVSSLNLSINHLHHPENKTVKHPLQKLQSQLHYIEYRGPEYLLLHCKQMKREIHQHQTLMKIQEFASQKVKDPTNNNKRDSIENTTAGIQGNVYDMCKQVGEYDEQQAKKLLAALQKNIVMGTNGLSDCSLSHEDIQLWISQPAQYTTPWLIQNSHTFKQWLDKWTVLCTKHRKIQTLQS